MEQLGDDVDLGAIARRQDDRFAHVVTLREPGHRLGEMFGGDRDAFEQRQRTAAMVDPDDENRHASTTLRRGAAS